QAEDGIRDFHVTGVQTSALPIYGQSIAFSYASTGHKNGKRAYDLGPEDLLALRPEGFVVADADNKFDASFRRKELLECGCSMHRSEERRVGKGGWWRREGWSETE